VESYKSEQKSLAPEKNPGEIPRKLFSDKKDSPGILERGDLSIRRKFSFYVRIFFA